jgi:hypothetical protein
MAVIENNSSDLFNFLKSRFELSDVLDENGKVTTEDSKMKVFSFDFTVNNHDLGSIVVSILDDNESSNSIKVYFGNDISESDDEAQKEFHKFLLDLRKFAKSHVLGFDVRDINKSRLTKRDISPVFESQFGALGGSVKTSVQPLENLKLIIKHSARIDPTSKNARSRRINRVYIANDKGERFLLPFTGLRACRAVARHIHNGGTLYDDKGESICQLVDELVSLQKFARKMRSFQVEDPKIKSVCQSVAERISAIKSQLSSMTTQGGYLRHAESLSNEPFEVDDEHLDNSMFGDLDEESQQALPYVWRAHNNRNLKEIDEFTDWVNEAERVGSAGQSSPLWNIQDELPGNVHKPKKKDVSGKESPLSLLSDADNKSNQGMASPLSMPRVDEPNRYKSKKEFEDDEDLTGDESPLSLVNEKDDMLDEFSLNCPYGKETALTHIKAQQILDHEGIHLDKASIRKMFGEEPIEKDKLQAYIDRKNNQDSFGE